VASPAGFLHSAFCIPRNLASLAQRRKEEKEVQHGIPVNADGVSAISPGLPTDY
jgi:hypothetical protein